MVVGVIVTGREVGIAKGCISGKKCMVTSERMKPGVKNANASQCWGGRARGKVVKKVMNEEASWGVEKPNSSVCQWDRLTNRWKK